MFTVYMYFLIQTILKKYQILICKKFTKNLSVFLYFSWTVYNKEKSTHNEELLNCAVL